MDLIQAPVIVTCGFLVGSYMKAFNIDHYNALLSMIPKFAACHISIVRKNVKGVDTSQTVLKELDKRLWIYSGFYADLPSAQLQLKLAYRAYWAAKLCAPDWRDDHN